MAEKYAGLTLGVDVSQVDKAVKSLQQFRRANDEAKQGVENFIDSERVAKQNAKEFADEIAKQKKEFADIAKVIDPTAARMEKLRQASAQLDKLWKKGIVPDDTFFELGEILETQERKLVASKKALTEEGRAAAENAKQKALAAAEARKFLETLKAQDDAASKTRSELLAMKAAQLGVTNEAAPFIAKIREQEKAVKDLGITTGQYKQAIRLLPAQITDVVTSLASGMPVWLVAIQQGGQIKDSFGGIANIFKSIKGFITPINVGFAALTGTLGYLAYNAYKASTELKEITKSVQDTTGISGEFAEKMAKGVKALSDASGKTAEEISKSYITTKDNADDAVLKLVKVGMTYDEAKEKVKQYIASGNFTALNKEIVDHQGLLNGIANLWDKATERKVNYASPTGGILNAQLGHELRSLNDAKNLWDDLTNAKQAYQEKLATDSVLYKKMYLEADRIAGKEAEINDLIEKRKDIVKGSEADKYSLKVLEIKKKELEDLKKMEEQRNKPKKAVGGKSVVEQLDKEVYVLQAQLALLKEHQEENDVISRQRLSLFSIEKQIQILQEAGSKRALTAGEKALLAEHEKALELARQKAELGDQIKLQERANKLHQDAAKFVRDLSGEQRRFDLQRLGMLDREIEQQLKLEQIKRDYIAGGGGENDLDLQKMLEAQNKLYEAQESVRADWLAGAKSAVAMWGDDVMNVNKNMFDIVTASLNGISDQFSNLLLEGKANFKDFAKNIISMIVQMITKMVIFNAIAGATGGKTWTLESLMKGAGFATGGYTGDGGKYDPAGVVHKGEFVFTKEATSRIGTKNLYKLMRGYASGGMVGGTSASGGGGVVGGSQFNFGGINVNIDNGSDPKGIESGVRMIVTEMFNKECSQGGRIYNFVKERTK